LDLKVTCSTFAFAKSFAEGATDLEGFIRACKGMGMDAVELNDGYVQSSGLVPHEVKALCDEAGLRIIALAAETNIYQALHLVTQEVYGGVMPWLEYCVELGIPLLRVNTAQPANGMHEVGDPAATESQVRERAIEAFQRVAAEAASRGVRLAMENHFGLTKTSQDTIRFCRDVDAEVMGINIDTGNFWEDCDLVRDHLASGGQVATAPSDAPQPGVLYPFEDVYTGIEAMAPHALYSHCKIYRLNADATNDEVLDYERILRIYAAAGYDGYLSIENFTYEDPFEVVPRAAKMLRAIVAALPPLPLGGEPT